MIVGHPAPHLVDCPRRVRVLRYATALQLLLNPFTLLCIVKCFLEPFDWPSRSSR